MSIDDGYETKLPKVVGHELTNDTAFYRGAVQSFFSY